MGRLRQALCCGPHKSTCKYLDFPQDDFVEMINKGQWVNLPYDKLNDLPGLHLSPVVMSPNGTGSPGGFATTLCPV